MAITIKQLSNKQHAVYIDEYELSNYSLKYHADKEADKLKKMQWYEMLAYVRHKYFYTLKHMENTEAHRLEKYLAGKAATSLLTPSDHYDPYK